MEDRPLELDDPRSLIWPRKGEKYANSGVDRKATNRCIEEVPTGGKGLLRDGTKRRRNNWKGAIREGPRRRR